MGLSAFGALLAIALAFMAQSPRMLTRFKLNSQRLDLRARAFTGYGLALLLLAFGFFIAGVPLDSSAPTAEILAENGGAGEEPAVAGTADVTETLTEAQTTGGNSGAMVGLPTSSSSGGAMVGLETPAPALTGTLPISGTAELSLPPGAATGEPSPAPSLAAEATVEPTATRFPTATPTPTPVPTLTPTPILGPTARVGDNTSTLPVRQLPGGAVLVVLVRGDTLLPLSGHAFHTGEVWREISTVNGVIGWVPERFLEYPEN